MTVRDEIALLLWIVLSGAIIHLSATSSLEHTRHVECERALELASLRRCTQRILLACGAIGRVGAELVDIETVQLTDLAVIAVNVVLLLEVCSVSSRSFT